MKAIDNALDNLAHFQRRVIADAMNEGSRAYWGRRARAFESARWRPGDFTGQTTGAERAEHNRRVTDAAIACRQRATVGIDPLELGALIRAEAA